MTFRGWLIGGSLAIALAAGTARDRSPAPARIALGGYDVLAVDFHVHTHPLSMTTVTPFDVVVQAERAGLDAVAVTPHHHVWVATIARWFAGLRRGPIILVGEEIADIDYHLLAVGINRTVPGGLPVAEAIARIHAQGGIAIAAHPVRNYWHGYPPEARASLDGAEVLHPIKYISDTFGDELRDFYTSTSAAAIGDTDVHGIGPFGVCRTYVFVTERSPAGILDAVRAKRTVVYDGERVYGDPELIALAARDGRLPALAAASAPAPLRTPDGALAMVALIAAVLVVFRRPL